MSYATVADATTRYGADYLITSCDRNGDGVLDTTAFQNALDDATDFMDSFLIGRYDLPLLSVPKVFNKFCCDIAVFYASESADTMTTEKRDRYQRAVSWLEAVAEGRRRLVASGSASTGPNKTRSVTILTQKTQSGERTCGSRRWTRDLEDELP